MKAIWKSAISGALVAATVSIASPAQASHACVLGPVPEETFIDTSGPIQIYAGRVPGYATAVAGWAAAYGTCVATTTVDCARQVGPQTPLVTVDPKTLTITIYDDNLVGDATCIFGNHD